MRVEAHLARGRPADAHRRHRGLSVGADEIVEAMRQDKKVERGALTFILARGIGDCFRGEIDRRPMRSRALLATN